MDNVGENIKRGRLQANMTQSDLAKELDITTQAISKWERNKSLPSLEMVIKMASVFKTDVNTLIGYPYDPTKDSFYEKVYHDDKYYWGVEPSDLCYKLLKLRPPTEEIRVLDVGCGEGKDAVFLAKCGYIVSGFDVSKSGVEKARRLAHNHGVRVNFFHSKVQNFRLKNSFDIIYSAGVLQFLKPEYRDEIMGNYRENTKIGGFNIISTLVEKPFLELENKEKPIIYPWKSGELLSYYRDWLIHEVDEYTYQDPHLNRQCKNIVIAQKII